MRSAVSVINIWIEKLVSVSVRLLNDIKSLFIRDKVYVNAFISTDAYGRVEHVNWVWKKLKTHLSILQSWTF